MDSRTNGLLLILAIVVAVWWYTTPEEQSVSQTAIAVESSSENSIVNSEQRRELNKDTVRDLMAIKDIPIEEIRSFGYGAIPILTELYEEADTNLEKSRIAWAFWKLGWKSPEIEEALIEDLDSSDANLKVWVQWGIAQSTVNDTVIRKVLYNLENDPSPFVRDKAACALASDFVHISESQRVLIYRGLIDGLSNDTQQIRASSIQALKVKTGQTKNYNAAGDAASREEAITAWNEWLEEYERNL